MPQPLTPLAARPLFARLSEARGMRVGIIGHLAISFALVASLAIAANLLVAEGIRVVEITRIAQQPLPGGILQSTAAPPIEAVDSPPNEEAEAPASWEAVERYTAALVVRARVPTQENDRKLAVALGRLRAERAALDTRGSALARELAAALGRFEQSGAALLARADERRVAIEAYAAHLAVIGRGLEEIVGRGWRLFGRVFTRENVLELRAQHDAVERALTALRAYEAVDDEAAVTTLIDEQRKFEAALATHERSLKRGGGASWFEETMVHLEHLRTLHAALTSSWKKLQEADGAFDVARDSVQTAAAAIAEPPPQRQQPVAPMTAPRPFVGPPVDLPEVEDLSARVSREEGDRGRRLVVAALTGGVLIVLLLISAVTVRSIVVPIRRLLKATADLRDGEHQPVPRGGIRELDTLGQSFNAMAQELLAARRTAQDQQVLLEARVAERTRQLQELAELDPLTGLPNRRHLLVLLNRALARRGAKPVGIFFLDLDNFKNINDSMGHGFGDEVLNAVAQRLRNMIGSSGFAARLGGDEFTVIVTEATSADDIREVGLAIIAAFQKTLPVASRDLLISVSVGASICPDHELTAEALLKAADAALFRAKALGRSQLCMFTPALLYEASAKFTTEQGLRRALERGEFELVFQPEIHAETLQPALVEALVRWRHADGSLKLPRDFLAVAEESGLIAEIGDWVLSSAIEAAAHWHHGEWPGARVAINVSARQLLDQRFVDKLQALLRQHDLPARCIEVELTESVLQTGPATIETLHRLRAAGVTTALDDFGTGYSSLASLERLPFSRIKLDKSLIGPIVDSQRAAAIARAIVWLCQSLDLAVTAEGVETLQQLEDLRALRPIVVQGYLISEPVTFEQLVPTMRQATAKLSLLLETASPRSVERVLEGEPRAGAAPAEAAPTSVTLLRSRSR